MIGDTFKNLKNYYTEIKVSETEIEHKWQELSANLPEQDLPRNTYHFKPYGFVFLSSVLVLLFITVVFAQASKPGNFLYPVHAATQEIAKKVSNTLIPETPAITPPKVHTSVAVMKKSPTIASNRTVTPTSHPTEKTESRKRIEKEHTSASPTVKVLGTETKENHFSTPEINHGNSGNPSNNSREEDTINNKGNSSENAHQNNNNSQHGNDK